MKKSKLIGTLGIFAGVLTLASCDSIFKDSIPAHTSSSQEESTPSESSPTIQKPSTFEISTDALEPSEPLAGLPADITNSILIHYLRYDANYTNWNIWFWETGDTNKQPDSSYNFEYQNTTGVIAKVSLEERPSVVENGLGLIVRYSMPNSKNDGWDGKDYDGDLTVSFEGQTPDEKGNYHIYVNSGEGTATFTKERSSLNNVKNSVILHYKRDDANYSYWDLWIWSDSNGDGAAYTFDYEDDYGVAAVVSLKERFTTDDENVMCIIRGGGSDWEAKDGTDEDRVISASNLTKDDNGNYHIYLKGGDPNYYTEAKL